MTSKNTKYGKLITVEKFGKRYFKHENDSRLSNVRQLALKRDKRFKTMKYVLPGPS